MGSILMHLCISEQIKNKYHFGNNFMIGCVLPDIYKRTIKSRDESHYIVQTVENGYVYHLPDLNKFVEDHKDQITTDEITIGYYAHLVEDYVWFKYVSGLFTKVKEGEDEQDLVRYRSEDFQIPHPEQEYCDDMYKDYYNQNIWLKEKCHINIDEFSEMVRNYTNDDRAIDIIKESCKAEVFRDGQNVFLDQACIERYMKASFEMFELNWEKIKNRIQ